MDEFKSIREQISIKEIAKTYGLNCDRNGTCNCPFHSEKSGSMHFFDKDNKFYCFGCGEKGDGIDLVAKLMNVSSVDAARIIDKDFGLGLYDNTKEHLTSKPKFHAVAPKVVEQEPETDYTDLIEKAHRDIGKTDYHRGLSQQTLDRFNIGFIKDWKHPKAPDKVPTSPRLIIPTSPTSYLARDTRKDLTDIQLKYKMGKVGQVHIFNESVLRTAKRPVFVTEGEIDAMSVCEVGCEAVALGSAANVGIMLKRLESIRPTQPLILALDNDKTGQGANDKLKEGLEKLGITYFEENIATGCKDPNEALCKNREAFTKAVRTAEYAPWLSHARTVLNAYAVTIGKFEKNYLPEVIAQHSKISNAIRDKPRVMELGNKLKTDRQAVISARTEIEGFAKSLRAIMQEGLHKIPPIEVRQNIRPTTADRTENRPTRNNHSKLSR